MNHADHTWQAFEFQGAVKQSRRGENGFIWKANNDDVRRGF